MERATTTRIHPGNLFLALSAFCLAVLLAFKALTLIPQFPAPAQAQGKIDRVMTDEVQKIKIGSFVWGDPKPRGGLPELKEQIKEKDFQTAAKTVAGIESQFKAVAAELGRRAGVTEGHENHAEVAGKMKTGSVLLFELALKDVNTAIHNGNYRQAMSADGKLFGAWSKVEADLTRLRVEPITLVQRLALLLISWLFFTALIVALTDKGKAVGLDDLPVAKEVRGINLMRSRVIRALLISPIFPAALQAFSLIFLITALVAGVMGPISTTENLATVLIWSLWWSPVMIISLVFFGKLWCGICPVGAITAITERFGAKRRSPDFTKRAVFGLLAFTPVAISIINFILMRAPLYGASYAVTQLPIRTSLYFGVWIMMAVGVSFLYERRAWCRYWCPVSAATSVIAKLAPVDFIHERAAGVTNCTTREYAGNYLTSDKRCVYCLKCTQAYPDAPVYARLRAPGAALIKERNIFSESAMALILVAVFPIGHGLGQLPFFKSPQLSELRVSYFTAIAICLAGYALVSKLSAWFVRQDFRRVFARFGGAYMPMGVMFSLSMAITGIMNNGGNWLNVTLPLLGIYGYYTPALVDHAVVTSWQHWSMSLATPIGGIWGLALVWMLARQYKIKVGGWLPHAGLIIAFVIFAKLLPMPMH